jgi:hypothetical protein
MHPYYFAEMQFTQQGEFIQDSLTFRNKSYSQKLTKVERITFSFGYRYNSYIKTKQSQDINGIQGIGAIISIPIGKNLINDEIDFMPAICYQINFMLGDESIKNSINNLEAQLIQNFLNFEYRQKISTKKYLAPYTGLSLKIKSISIGNFISTFPIATFIQPGFDAGIYLVFIPLGIGIKYDSPNNSILFDFNLAF